jgi:hypothetical protein
MSQGPLLNPEEWRRRGRGRELQFLATDAEVQSWLVRARDELRVDFSLVGADALRETQRTATRRRFSFPVDAMVNSLDGPGGRRINLWLIDQAHCGRFDKVEAGDLDRVCSTKGQVLVQPVIQLADGGVEPGRFAVATEVVNGSCESIRHVGAERVFDVLRRNAMRDLVHRTIIRLGDGSEVHDPAVRMTREAANQRRGNCRWRPEA